MDHKQLEFVTAVIGSVAERLRRRPSEVYNALSSSGIIGNYLVPAYDVLHTFSREYVTDDVVEYLREKGGLTC